jgi:hypothetical protein
MEIHSLLHEQGGEDARPLGEPPAEGGEERRGPSREAGALGGRGQVLMEGGA